MKIDRFAQLNDQLVKLDFDGLTLLEFEPMRAHTSFRIGGPVRLMAVAERAPAQMDEVIRLARALDIAPVFIGNGTDLLVPDEGVEAFVVKTTAAGITPEGTTVHAEAGALLARVAVAALDAGLAGLEFAHGIPGMVGGGLTMNAGAYDGELSQVTGRVFCLDQTGRALEFDGAQCGFSYRHSIFSGGDYYITGAVFTLQEGVRAAIRARMDELSARRRARQPLEYPSAGSTFKRPAGHFAAALIEECGLKGLTVGGAQVSEKHAGFIVNRGGATCADVRALMERVRSEVARQTGVILEPEVKILTKEGLA